METQPTACKRPRCPFYGFGRFGYKEAAKTLMDSKGNQCALIVTSLHPCDMEVLGIAPNWDECSIKATGGEGVLKEMKDFRVFPSELHPEGVQSWQGIPFEEWMRRVMEAPR